MFLLSSAICRRRNYDVLARTALSYQTKLKGLMPTKLPTAFRLDGRTVDSSRSEHQRCQAAKPAFSNGKSCFGPAMWAQHAFASRFIKQLTLSMSTEVEAHNTRHRPVGDSQDSRVNLALRSVTSRSYSIYSALYI